MKSARKPGKCSMCKKPATRMVDGEPSCDEHAVKIYEHQVEDYVANLESTHEWLDVPAETVTKQ